MVMRSISVGLLCALMGMGVRRRRRGSAAELLGGRTDRVRRAAGVRGGGGRPARLLRAGDPEGARLRLARRARPSRARVLARDPSDAVISRVAVTGADGTYELVVPARRDASGAPVEANITLRADAQAYETFPKAPRVALPIDLSTAAGKPLAIESAATEISLLPLSDSEGLGSISGVVHADQPGGTLLVAGGATGAADPRRQLHHLQRGCGRRDGERLCRRPRARHGERDRQRRQGDDGRGSSRDRRRHGGGERQGRDRECSRRERDLGHPRRGRYL